MLSTHEIEAAETAAENLRQAANGAIVLGGDTGALAVVRSLGRMGVPVLALSDNNRIAGFSRFVSRRAAWPGPLDPDALEFLENLARENGPGRWVLIPAGDAEVKLVAENHDRLARSFVLVTQPWQVVRHALDKHLAYRRAGELGIPVPKAYRPASRADILDLDFRFPLILKPSLKEARNELTLEKAWRVADRASLLARYDEAVELVGDSSIVIQEYIPGDGSTQFSFAGAFVDGKAVGSLVARRTRQHPTVFGTGCFVETVQDDEVERLGTSFLGSLGYTGLCEMEFKFDARDRSYNLIDVNPRVWTWTDIGRIGGVDFVDLLWRIANRQPLPEARRAAAGAKWMYLSRDVFAALSEIRAGRLTAAEWRNAFRRPIGFATFEASDPLPALIDLPLGYARRFTRSRNAHHAPALPKGRS